MHILVLFFSGLYNYEDHCDPVCVKKRTGYVINVSHCPVIWNSQLQTETAISTIQVEVISLTEFCRELIPIVAMVKEIGTVVGLSASETAPRCMFESIKKLWMYLFWLRLSPLS